MFLRMVLFNFKDLTNLIYIAKEDAEFRGRILEYLILGCYANLPSRKRHSYDLTSIFNPEESSQNLDFTLERKKLVEFDDDTFEETRLYVPDNFTLPVFDAFCKTSS